MAPRRLKNLQFDFISLSQPDSGTDCLQSGSGSVPRIRLARRAVSASPSNDSLKWQNGDAIHGSFARRLRLNWGRCERLKCFAPGCTISRSTSREPLGSLLRLLSICGAGVLALPSALAALGWLGGLFCLFMFYIISLGASYVLASLYEVKGKKYGRYADAVAAFLGECCMCPCEHQRVQRQPRPGYRQAGPCCCRAQGKACRHCLPDDQHHLFLHSVHGERGNHRVRLVGKGGLRRLKGTGGCVLGNQQLRHCGLGLPYILPCLLHRGALLRLAWSM
jgi:hypothetical protein